MESLILREQQERFVRPFVALAHHADYAHIEVVESFDEGVEKHGNEGME